MFFVSYLWSELLRRRTRTILTLLGLAVGVALVIAITSLSRGLDDAQASALDPLSSIGTDLTVTLNAQQGSGFGGGRDLIQANRSVLTDLSKLGKPGTHFVHDFFLPGTQLTFTQSAAKQVAALPGVSSVATGLTLLAVHQSGTVPKIVASFRTGGRTFRIRRNITPLTQAEIAKVQACFAKARQSAPSPQRQGGGGLSGGGRFRGGGGGFFFGPAARACLPARFQQFRGTFRTPEQTLKQVLDPPQTNITSSAYSIAGVDISKPQIGLVTPSQVVSGGYLRGAHEALVGTGYAAAHELKLGSALELNGTSFRVVGLVRPPLGGQSADVYLPLTSLQQLASEHGNANVVLVRAASGADVGRVQQEIQKEFPQAQVASAKQVADRISGSLVDASNLSHTLGIALAIAAAVAAFLVAALLTLASVGKRVRELGTLKALGWTQRLVVRQVVGESLAQGILGGLLGVGLGIAAALCVRAFGPTLSASSTAGGGDLFGLGRAVTVTDRIGLGAPLAVDIVLLGFLLAVAGGLLAGAAGALRAARLRPADALRQVE